MNASLENDMSCLLESIQYLGNDENQMIQALEHLAEMTLQEHGAAIFRNLNGNSLVSKMIFQKNCTSSVSQKGFILLGNSVLSCSENKKSFCNEHTMEFLKSKIFSDAQNTKMIASGAYFVACLCSNSEKVQNKARKLDLVERLVSLYRKYHPKGVSNPPKEQWFEKPLSNCPIVLTHISHALKSLMNKPKNVENQIACSRLLNLTLSTLATDNFSNESKIESLNFIADVIYENEKTQSIFNMIGGMRILCQLLSKVAQRLKDSKKSLELAKILLDTLIIAVTDHNANKESGLKNGLVKSLVLCLNSQSFVNMKVFLCLSELVYQNETCQKALVSCNAVPEIINIMSLSSDEMISKVGTSILQNCVKYQDELNGGAKKPTVADFKEHNQTPGLMSFKSSENDITKSTPSNLRRGKRSLLREELSFTKEEENKDASDMLDILKSQRELLQSFQEEIQNLRAEVRSQAASECDMVDQGTVASSSKKRNVLIRSTIPSRRLYPNLCPGTAPSKRKRMEPSMACWTPQSTRQRINASKAFSRTQISVDQIDLQRVDQFVTDDEEEDLEDDDERPALNKSSKAKRRPTLNMKQQSLFEKVQLWQRKNLDTSVDKDGFAIPYMTPLIKKSMKGQLSASSSYFKTPDVVNPKQLHRLQFAPKKKEATKKRCLTSSDEGFSDTVEVDSDGCVSGHGIRRTLFDASVCNEAASVCQDEQKAPVVISETSDLCHACNPSILLDSTTCINAIESNLNTCDFHYEFIKTIKQSYSIFNRQQQRQYEQQLSDQQSHSRYQKQHQKQQQQPVFKLMPVSMTTKRIPNRSLLNKEKEWESMSVFSYRSEASLKSHITEKTTCTGRIHTTPMSRRRRKDYSQAEVNYIIDGAERYGRRWKIILNAYPFQPGRTAIDLKDKYKKLKFTDSTLAVPFTAQELVNLKHGVARYGQQWPHILERYGFEETRTSDELH